MIDQTADPTYESLWTVREVATYLSVPQSAVYRARSDHGLPTVKIGGTMRFKPASVRAWAAERESAEAPRPGAVEPPTPPSARTVDAGEAAPVKLLV